MESIEEALMQAACLKKKSKKLAAIAALTLVSTALSVKGDAQTFAEWFRQKSTQKKYLAQQVAALQVYAAYYRIGNSITRRGLTSVTGWLDTEYSMHNNYYASLNAVKPAIKNSRQVKEVLAWQTGIFSVMEMLNKMPGLTPEERKYLVRVRAALYHDCNLQVKELQTVISDNTLNMGDGDRLKVIDVIHSAIADNYRFACDFLNRQRVYMNSRRQEMNDIRTGRNLYDIR